MKNSWILHFGLAFGQFYLGFYLRFTYKHKPNVIFLDFLPFPGAARSAATNFPVYWTSCFAARPNNQ